MRDPNAKTWAEYFSKMTDEEVIQDWQGVYQIVNGDVACYGTRDMIRLDATGEELAKRGYRIQNDVPEIVKVSGDEEE